MAAGNKTEIRTPENTPRSPHWPATRAAHLKAHPTCEACGGTDELNVHHVKPYHLHPDLELVESNLVTLCEHHDCHLALGHLFDWKSWNVDVRTDAASLLQKVKNRPKHKESVPMVKAAALALVAFLSLAAAGRCDTPPAAAVTQSSTVVIVRRPILFPLRTVIVVSGGGTVAVVPAPRPAVVIQADKK